MFLFLDLDLKFLKDRVGPRRTLSVLPTFNKYLEGCKESKTTVLYFGFQVGIAACQIARAYGLKVLGTAGTEEGQNIVLQNGAHEVFNHRELNYIDKIKKSVGEKGIDVIIEMLANVNLSNDLDLLSYGGRVIVSILVSFYHFEALP